MDDLFRHVASQRYHQLHAGVRKGGVEYKLASHLDKSMDDYVHVYISVVPSKGEYKGLHTQQENAKKIDNGCTDRRVLYTKEELQGICETG